MYLPLAEFAHNSWPHDITKLSPHQLLFGMKPQIHVEVAGKDQSPMATDHLINMQQAQVHASQALLHQY